MKELYIIWKGRWCFSYRELYSRFQLNASTLRSKRSVRSFHAFVCLSRSRKLCEDQIHEDRTVLLAAVVRVGFRDCKSTWGLFRSRKEMTCQDRWASTIIFSTSRGMTHDMAMEWFWSCYVDKQSTLQMEIRRRASVKNFARLFKFNNLFLSWKNQFLPCWLIGQGIACRGDAATSAKEPLSMREVSKM